MIERGLQSCLDVADCVIVTGGLGPTEDDLTRQVIAAHFKLALEEDAEALERMVQRYARRGRSMPHSNRIQALVPRGADVIQNARGTAAGFYLRTHGKHVFVTPGIPFEMHGMLDDYILPRIIGLVGEGRRVRQAFVKVYGLPESEINERIRPMVVRGRNPLLGLLPRKGTITIEITAYSSAVSQADELIRADIDLLRAALGNHIISEDGRELPQVVGDLLCTAGMTIGSAEEGSAGLLAARLAAPAGSAAWYLGGVVQVPTAANTHHLGKEISGDEAALELARGARAATGALLGVGVGPVIVPQDSTPERPYGSVHVAVVSEETHRTGAVSFTRDRLQIREWAADAALAQVRLAVLELGAGAGDTQPPG
jgi:nicotinamide-nucleotide amidase